MRRSDKPVIPEDRIIARIFFLRKERVMLDFHLAELYQVETKVLKQAVRRNIERFPDDFMFELTKEEWSNLRSQFVTSSSGWGGTRYTPFAFTEQGIAMLSSILKSKRAVAMNIAIIRTFVFLRRAAVNYEKLLRKLQLMERKYEGRFKEIYKALSYLINPPAGSPKRIGFKRKDEID
ncbi:MAG: ORF6N domain-containing protein [Flammeovirgaceae bacterium]|nr:MAG: ORF6N domain-containing protein [Flammeovirgaceae bacterium]